MLLRRDGKKGHTPPLPLPCLTLRMSLFMYTVCVWWFSKLLRRAANAMNSFTATWHEQTSTTYGEKDEVRVVTEAPGDRAVVR